MILGRDVNTPFEVDTTINYMYGLNKEILMQNAITNNVGILQEKAWLNTAEYDVRINNATLIPKLSVNAAYNYNNRITDNTSAFKNQTILGPTVGATLSWNIFDGGATKVRIKNAQIEVRNQEISLKQREQTLLRNVNNAWGIYQNALFVLEAQKKNLETNQRNFDRTMDQQKLGQITSIVFRQAQLNLLNAQINYNKAKYAAKKAELAILQLSGELMIAQF